jgi:hypothetical protein
MFEVPGAGYRVFSCCRLFLQCLLPIVLTDAANGVSRDNNYICCLLAEEIKQMLNQGHRAAVSLGKYLTFSEFGNTLKVS